MGNSYSPSNFEGEALTDQVIPMRILGGGEFLGNVLEEGIVVDLKWKLCCNGIDRKQ